MHRIINTGYCLLWLVIIVSALLLFPSRGGIVLLPIILLCGVGGWLYGRTVGFLIGLFATIVYFVFTSILFADIHIYYQDRVTGLLVTLMAISITGTLRNNINSINETNELLDKIVEHRTTELNALANNLLERTEELRTIRGQELHDDLGQHLAGIRLYTASLMEKFSDSESPAGRLLKTISEDAACTHNMIRRTCRSLFPVELRRTGLHAAMAELAAALQDISDLKCNIHFTQSLEFFHHKKALHVFRMTQESCYAIIKAANPNWISIRVVHDASLSAIILDIHYDGALLDRSFEYMHEHLLIEYRLHALSARMEFPSSSEHAHRMVFKIPASGLVEKK